MRQSYQLMKKILFYTTIFGLLVANTGYRYDGISIALVTKIVEEVMKKSLTTDWSTATKGETLSGGDQVRTGENSLAIIKFMDNSIIRVREESELTINLEKPGGTILKTIELHKGAMGFDIRKQQNEQFRFTSPTSVASIKGTKGKWSGGEGNDTLIVTEDTVNLINIISNMNLDISAGSIGFSNSDGALFMRKATAEELAQAENAATSGTLYEFKLELQDSTGTKKQLKLRYNEK